MPRASQFLRTVQHFWQKTCQVVLDGFYPRLCRHCEVLLPHEAPRQGVGAWFCGTCQQDMEATTAPYCSVCGEMFSGAMTEAFRCQNCTGHRVAYDFAVAGYQISEPVREVIHRYKYGRDLSLRAALADLLLPALEDPRLASEDLRRWLLVPVPLHFSRQIWRGFNQSWELCRQISQRTGIPAAQSLSRQTRTVAQAHLQRRKRLANLRGAFALSHRFSWRPPQELKGRNILLVDDVLTTGATAHECAKVLKQQAGVEKVVVITAARG
ncbi:ComF family protein [Prosthecobacter dejongeii]|uniref:ComF family protein n=1 Tax=Prosthecobacter dejongeii TaxID=48465 RepID=A0A7W7YH45_9BACT|nr:ComF family protein [Prosthecobacter dejongeii]MBB5036101.1 ComF family protein [Prosthecobacter dejongeii]